MELGHSSLVAHSLSPWLVRLADGTRIAKRPSDHCQPREDTAGGFRYLVIHCISLPPGQFGTHWIDALFIGGIQAQLDRHDYFERLRDLRVSAHFVIDRNGAVTQYVPLSHSAWHAGISEWGGVASLNGCACGVELVGDETTPYTSGQYRALAQLIQSLKPWMQPDFRSDDLVRHSDIAPGRKTDPGSAFDLERLKRLLPAQ